MLDDHEDLPVAASQVEIAVSPGMQLAAPPQRLSRPCGTAFASVVDEQDGGLEATLYVTQEAEDGSDLCDGIFVPDSLTGAEPGRDRGSGGGFSIGAMENWRDCLRRTFRSGRFTVWRRVLPFGGRAGGSGPAGLDRGWRDRRRGLPFALDGGVTEPIEPPAPAAAHPPSDGPHQMADQGPQAVTPGAGRQQLVRHRAEQHPGALAPVGEAHRAVPAPLPAAGVVRAQPHRHIAVRLLAPAPGNIDAARMQPPARPQRADEHRAGTGARRRRRAPPPRVQPPPARPRPAPRPCAPGRRPEGTWPGPERRWPTRSSRRASRSDSAPLPAAGEAIRLHSVPASRAPRARCLTDTEDSARGRPGRSAI